jgi:hypothetical protein
MYVGGGKWIDIRGGTDVIDLTTDRNALDYSTFDVGDYVTLIGDIDTQMPWEWDFADTNRAGCYPKSTITQSREGNVTFSTPGQIINNTVFYGKVSVTAAGVTFFNCYFLGPTTNETESVVLTNAGATPTTFIDCCITTQNPARWSSGMKCGTGQTIVKRCWFFLVTDGITPGNNWSGGVFVESSVFGPATLYAPDPGAAGGVDDNQTHVDWNQLVGGTHVVTNSSFLGRYHTSKKYMEGNQPPIGFGGTPQNPEVHLFGDRYYALGSSGPNGGRFTTSCFMWSPATYKLDRIEYTGNWFRGAVYPINCAGYTSPSQLGTPGTIKINNNHWDNVHRGGISDKAIIANVGIQPYIECTGNTRISDGAPLSKTDLIQNG